MYKFATIYRRVDEPDQLEEFFANVHLQLAEQLPGLQKREVSRVTHKPGGQDSRFHLMFELYFASENDFHVAMGSDIGIQLIHALKPWADAKILTWFFAESFEEDISRAG
jgi:uncharacterized protein (TIGR02118 family)